MTPAELFTVDTRYKVPLFQRPYVWTKDRQWGPLWQDVRLLAEQILPTLAPEFGPRLVPTHFLGAIVLEQAQRRAGSVSTYHVVDGQQRLMTLQLLLDASATVATRRGEVHPAEELRALVRNRDGGHLPTDHVFKVWPSKRDQHSFRTALTEGSDAAATGTDTAAVLVAHAFFLSAVDGWVGAGGRTAPVTLRLTALSLALRQYLKLVVIDLDPGDNSQVIFESLNHRAVPLLAADLIKNMVFQAAERQELDVEALYEQHWSALESPYWRRDSAGEDSRPRIDVFVRHWLVMRLLREVPADHLVPAFRGYLYADGQHLQDVLADLAADARVFAALESAAKGSDVERFRYRVLDVLELETLTPVLLLLMRWHGDGLATDQFGRALRAIESWAVRRGLAKVANNNTLQVMIRLVRALRAGDRSQAGDITEVFLAGLASQDGWPADAQVRLAMTTPSPRITLAKRNRMVLEAVEDRLRSAVGRSASCPRDLTIEHIMPTKWRSYWPVMSPGDPSGRQRDRLVSLIGNLTLVSKSLNLRMANLPWTDEEARLANRGSMGKHSHLRTTPLTLNALIVSAHEQEWTDEAIVARSAELAAAAVEIWPLPRTTVAVPAVAEFEPEPPPSTEAQFEAITRFLAAQTARTIKLTFADIERVLGFALPEGARSRPTSWRPTKSAYGKAIFDGGYQLVSPADTGSGFLELARANAKRRAPARPGGGARRAVRGPSTQRTISSHPVPPAPPVPRPPAEEGPPPVGA